MDLASAMQQLDYRNSIPRPGESSQQFWDRKRQEHSAGVQQQMNLAQTIRDQQERQKLETQYSNSLNASGVTSPSGGGFLSAQQGAAQKQADQARMQRERDQSFAEIAYERDFYRNDPDSQAVRGSMMAQMNGTNVPFTPEVVNNLIGAETDAEASSLRSEQNMIRSRMANSGMGGSGVGASAQLNAQRLAGRRSQAAARQIRTTRDLENFRAQEQGRQEAAASVAQESSRRWAATKEASDLRSQYSITRHNSENTDTVADAFVQAAQMQASGGQGQMAPRSVLPIQTSGRITGNEPKSQYGGVTWLNGQGVQPFRQSTESTGYQQFGLGGSEGPFGAISRMADSNRNYGPQGYTGQSQQQQQQQGQQQPAPWAQQQQQQAPGTWPSGGSMADFGAPTNNVWNGNFSPGFGTSQPGPWALPGGDRYDQNQANAVFGSSAPAGSRAEWLGRGYVNNGW